MQSGGLSVNKRCWGSTPSPSRIAERDGLIWFFWFVWSVWFNQTNETDQTDEIDQTDRTDQTNKTDAPGARPDFDGLDHLYRIREGDSRIVYVIRGTELIVLAVKSGILGEVSRS